MPVLANPKHERFAQMVGTGAKATPAYRKAFGATGRTAEVNASKLAAETEVRLRIEEIRRQYEAHRAEEADGVLKKQFLTLDRKRELLSSFAENGTLHVRDRVKCIELDAKLAGELKGDNGTQVSVTVVLGHQQVLDRVRAMSPILAGLTKAGAKFATASRPS